MHPTDSRKTVAIIQSSYLPWRGYFDIIRRADCFVLMDSVQYTRRDWRNRNRIKAPTGVLWLSVPVQVKGRYHQSVWETQTVDDSWRRKHWNSLVHHYGKARYFQEYAPLFETLYLMDDEVYLSRINRKFIEAVNGILGIETPIVWDHELELSPDRNLRLLHICRQLNADNYLSGPSAKGYLDESLFEAEGITVSWMDYSGYKPYDQLYPPFEDKLSIIDLIFNEGPDAACFLGG